MERHNSVLGDIELVEGGTGCHPLAASTALDFVDGARCCWQWCWPLSWTISVSSLCVNCSGWASAANDHLCCQSYPGSNHQFAIIQTMWTCAKYCKYVFHNTFLSNINDLFLIWSNNCNSIIQYQFDAFLSVPSSAIVEIFLRAPEISLVLSTSYSLLKLRTWSCIE